MGIKGLVSEWD